MNREYNFFNSFNAQLTALTSWQMVEAQEIAMLAPSEFPSFALIPGKTKYTAYDIFGKASEGEQEYLLKFHFSHAARMTLTTLNSRSDYILILENFMNTNYTPPTVQIGDTARIDRIRIIEIEPPTLIRGETRTTITIKFSYHFTMF